MDWELSLGKDIIILILVRCKLGIIGGIEVSILNIYFY